jgi:uncharacterized membrane protein
MIYGLGAALGWGLADVMVALIARRIGSFVTLVIGQLASLIAFTMLWLSGVTSVGRLHPALLLLPLIGVSGALSYVCFYRALELGPIALVSPIAAGYAAIVIALALLILREPVPPLAVVGAFVAIGGVPNTDWAADTAIVRDQGGYLVTGPDLLINGKAPASWPLERAPYYLETAVPGSFAAGDVRHRSIKRVATAAGEGAMAIAFVHRYLEETA